MAQLKCHKTHSISVLHESPCYLLTQKSVTGRTDLQTRSFKLPFRCLDEHESKIILCNTLKRPANIRCRTINRNLVHLVSDPISFEPSEDHPHLPAHEIDSSVCQPQITGIVMVDLRGKQFGLNQE